jgi:hypothetical protein
MKLSLYKAQFQLKYHAIKLHGLGCKMKFLTQG